MYHKFEDCKSLVHTSLGIFNIIGLCIWAFCTASLFTGHESSHWKHRHQSPAAISIHIVPNSQSHFSRWFIKDLLLCNLSWAFWLIWVGDQTNPQFTLGLGDHGSQTRPVFWRTRGCHQREYDILLSLTSPSSHPLSYLHQIQYQVKQQPTAT